MDQKTSEALVELALRRQAEDDFYTFVKLAWHIVEPGAKFQDGWFLRAICEHLEEIYYGRIRRLLINQPPRTGKSSLVSVLFPAWVWLKNPTEQIMCVSYAEKLAIRDNVKARRLIKSDWFTTRFPHLKLTDDQDTKNYVENTSGGYRYVTGVDGSVTGFGSNLLICLPYESVIFTDKGALPIGKIVEEKIDCNVVSYNHDKNIAEYKKIENYESSDGRELYEIEMFDGSLFRCTGEHPVYVENRGYIAAKKIQNGDVVWSMTEEEIRILNGVVAQ